MSLLKILLYILGFATVTLLAVFMVESQVDDEWVSDCVAKYEDLTESNCRAIYYDAAQLVSENIDMETVIWNCVERTSSANDNESCLLAFGSAYQHLQKN